MTQGEAAKEPPGGCRINPGARSLPWKARRGCGRGAACRPSPHNEAEASPRRAEPSIVPAQPPPRCRASRRAPSAATKPGGRERSRTPGAHGARAPPLPPPLSLQPIFYGNSGEVTSRRGRARPTNQLKETHGTGRAGSAPRLAGLAAGRAAQSIVPAARREAVSLARLPLLCSAWPPSRPAPFHLSQPRSSASPGPSTSSSPCLPHLRPDSQPAT